MTKSIKARIAQLERELTGAGIIGLREFGGKLVSLPGGEFIPFGDFFKQYPDGVLIHLIKRDTPPDIVVSWEQDDSE